MMDPHAAGAAEAIGGAEWLPIPLGIIAFVFAPGLLRLHREAPRVAKTCRRWPRPTRSRTTSGPSSRRCGRASRRSRPSGRRRSRAPTRPSRPRRSTCTGSTACSSTSSAGSDRRRARRGCRPWCPAAAHVARAGLPAPCARLGAQRAALTGGYPRRFLHVAYQHRSDDSPQARGHRRPGDGLLSHPGLQRGRHDRPRCSTGSTRCASTSR